MAVLVRRRSFRYRQGKENYDKVVKISLVFQADGFVVLSPIFFFSMNIQYYGDYCFKISTKPAGRATEDIIIWTDLLEKGSGLRSPQGQADILLLSHGKNEEIRESLKGEPVIIDAPGEYSIKGIAILGYPAFRDEKDGTIRGQNTLFAFESEDIHVAFLGALGHDLSPDLFDKLNGVDVLFVPVGGSDTLDPKRIAELTRKIEPKMVIPMHYQIPGLTLPLQSEKSFCEAIGNCPKETVSKLNIKKKEMEGKKLEVVLLERGV